MSTIKEVSQMAQVSSATVSRVINNPESVKVSTRERVIAAMKTLKYRHNGIAASLASNKSHTVGFVVPELHGFFFGSMMSGSESVFRKHNKHMLVAAGHSNEAEEKDAIEYLLGRRCDALILLVEAVTDEFLIGLTKQDIHFVVVNRYIPQIGERCIALDNETGGYLATRTLIDAGHKEIAYISGSLWKADGQARMDGHLRALDEAKIKSNPALIVEGTFQAQSGFEGVNQLLSSGCPFSALACGNDEMASGAIDALRRANLEVPAEVSVIGFDNVEFCQYLSPRLSTVNYPTRGIGESAAHWILNEVYENKHISIEHIVRPEIIIRDSVLSHIA